MHTPNIGPELQRLIDLLAKLPGLGPRSAKRAALHLLKKREPLMRPLAFALSDAADKVKACGSCGNWDSIDPCAICAVARRDPAVLCVVQDVGDLWALERAGAHKGRYHVLGGLLSPLDGVGPKDLNIGNLVARAGAGGVKEVVLALPATVVDALSQVEREVDLGTFPPTTWAASETLPEDIHAAVEARLVELCGDAARRLHAGRSRNDQVATDVLLWLKTASIEVEDAVRALARALVTQAEAHRETVIYAYTHLQRAQPVTLAHHLLGHVEALRRDVERLGEARQRADRSALGAGACVGSSLPLAREATARQLGFARVAIHSLDAVADRDWAIEFTSVAALVMTHLSRLAEELVLWSAPEFGLVTLGDAWCTGSSMLPHKRNPDVAELVRGKTVQCSYGFDNGDGDLTTT